jgi:hypothetical protein
MTIEKRPSGILSRLFIAAVPVGVVRLRVWFDDEHNISECAAAIVDALSPTGTVALEFWDESPSVLKSLEALSLHTTRPNAAGHLVLSDTPAKDLTPVLERLSFASFGAWLAMPQETLAKVVTLKSDKARMEAMPDGAIMLVFSLYDKNVELVSKGLDEGLLRTKLQAAAARTGARLA